MIQMTKTQLKEIMTEYKQIIDTMEDSDEILKIKQQYNSMSDPDKIILTLYAHFQSQRKVGSILGVAHTTLGKELNRIRQQYFGI